MVAIPHVRSSCQLRYWKHERRCGAKHISMSKCVQNTVGSQHFSKLRCWKSERRCGAKHILKWKCSKHHMIAPLLDVLASFFLAGASSSALSKKWVKQRCRFCSGCKNDSRHGTFEEDLKRCISHGRRSTRDISGRHVDRSGRWFLERGFILEQQTFRFAKTIFRGIDRQIDRYTDRYTDKQIDK